MAVPYLNLDAAQDMGLGSTFPFLGGPCVAKPFMAE